jgi:D-alanine transaminase
MTVYLNGKFLPLAQAQVSVLDRGFLFGDGVYEVIPVYGRHFFRLELHLQRLEHSLRAIRLENPRSLDQWRCLLQELVAVNDGQDQALYLQVTRGPATRDHAFPERIEPTVFAMSNPLNPLPADIRTRGIAAITREDIRWKYCHIKAITLLANTLLRQDALEAGAQEALLLRDEQVTEGAASNIFIVHGGGLITPPQSAALLSGITRDLVLELAQKGRIPCREEVISARDLIQAEEIWVTSSTREIVPVTCLDGKAVGTGRPGPLWREMDKWYQAYKAEVRAGRGGN